MNSKSLFKQRFQYFPKFSSEAHGRVNLIGEHTDYNNGFVLPTLIEQKVEVSLGLRSDSQIVGISEEFGENSVLSKSKTDGTWLDFVRGALYYICEEGYSIKGLDIAVTSNIPTGSGLSSSAAFEIALLRALCQMVGLELSSFKIAQIGQSIEHNFIGTYCGIMDQISSSMAKFGQALYLDCENMNTEIIPIFKDYTFVIVHSGDSRKLSEGLYNERKRESEQAAKNLNIPSLRQAEISNLNLIKDNKILKRARHVITENDRVQKAVQFLKNNNAKAFGELMNESHFSMDKDYEISSSKLNKIVKTAQSYGALGARLTGAGFGGCAVILTSNTKKKDITNKILNNFPKSYLVTNISQNNIFN